jgi:hypothetical protein
MIDPATKKEYACPLNGKLCVDGVREDFPTNSVGGKVPCRWWQHVAGKDPQTEKVFDAFDCAVAWMPSIGIEGSQMSRQTASSVDKLANEVAFVKTNVGALAGALRVAAADIRQGIETGGISLALPPAETKPNVE